MTTVELAKVTGLSDLAVGTAVNELQHLYLLSAPGLDHETPRFAIDGNLAVLVRSEIQGSPRETQIRNGVASVDGKNPATQQTEESRDTIRQVRLLLNARRTAEAEELLSRALTRNPDDALLLALLGMCYVDWQPRRTTDARASFERSSDLGYADRGMYLAWSRIEGELGEWARAVRAAERGLALRPKDPMLLFAAGRAKRGVARQHLRALSEERAKDCFDDADAYFEGAIAEARNLKLRANDISSIYEAWVVSAQQQRRPKAICYRIHRWAEWKPSDSRLRSYMEAHLPECQGKPHRKVS